MAHVFGIDLGTTYSCIAYINDKGEPEVINNAEGANTTPSVVNFASPTTVGVGQFAKDNAVIDPENTISFVKTLMGKSDFAINYNGEDRSPQEVSSYIIRKLVGDAEKQLGEKIENVVITCPAYFGVAERVATADAGKIAGLNVLDVFNEPTAAALFYGCTNSDEEKTILVYDLGGGTFDVTIMKINKDEIEVICSDGDHDLGGKNWDAALMNKLVSEFCEQTGFDGEFDEYAEQDLQIKAEKAKQQLSAMEQVPVMLEAPGGLRARIIITRETFNTITKTLLDETLNLTDSAIAVAKDKGYSIDEIILVGGSTKMPQVTEALESRYGISMKVVEPDQAVAKGAAVHALSVLANGGGFDAAGADIPLDALPPVPGPKKIIYATTKSYAIRCLCLIPGTKEHELKCNNLIIKNRRIEDGVVKVSKKYGTSVANQASVELAVYESDFMEDYYEVDEDYNLGNAVLELSGDLPEGSPIEVTFALRQDGVLEVTGRDLTNNKEVHTVMEVTGIMSEEQVEETRKKAMAVDIVAM